MAKLKVTAFKPSGKFYDEQTTNLAQYSARFYPTVYNLQDKSISVDQLMDLQRKYTYELQRDLMKYRYPNLSPLASGWDNDFIFIFDGIFEDNEQGFLTFMMRGKGYNDEW